MLIASIRRLETLTIDVAGESLEDLHRQLNEQCPEGFELVHAPVQMTKRTTRVTTTGTFERRVFPDQSGEEQLEGENLDQIRAALPEGWKILAVRAG